MPAHAITSRAVKGTEPMLPLSVYWRLVHRNPSLVAERKTEVSTGCVRQILE